jgi:hypothetical protein
MGLSDAFNSYQYTVRKITDAVLAVSYDVFGVNNILVYDFVGRIMLTRTNHSDGGISVTPFAQLDRETLIEMRDKLIELKGNPPELPAEAAATSAPAKKFNL